MNAAVIGLGFGDEAKGLTTDFLVERCGNPKKTMVTRFSGGQQAGHTVVKHGVSHVFSNFGSGTLAGAPTYWSRFCTIDPVAILREYKDLIAMGLDPILYIDNECPVTTMYDKISNQMIDRNNGTCGTGVGATHKREEAFYSLKAIDLKYPSVFKAKLLQIAKYYGREVTTLAQPHLKDFIWACKTILHTNNINLKFGLPHATHNVFEGSQGMMLDQDYGFFPHVTRSKTDTTNVAKVLGSEDFEIFLVTRAYQTRHGNGPMTNEDKPLFLKNNEKETNVLNTFQGSFRKSVLDLDLLRYAIERDRRLTDGSHKVHLVMTCLDQLEEYSYTVDSRLITLNYAEEFVKHISLRLSCNFDTVFYSESPDSRNIIELK